MFPFFIGIRIRGMSDAIQTGAVRVQIDEKPPTRRSARPSAQEVPFWEASGGYALLVESTDGALIPFHRRLANLRESGRRGTIAIRGEFDAATNQDDPINGPRTGRPAEAGHAGAVGKTNTPYPSMAPIDRYLIPDAGTDISLAKSAAPKSISDSAEVILLKRQGLPVPGEF